MSDDVTTDIERRKLLGSVAAIGGAVPLLAACGSDAPSSKDPAANGGGGDPEDSDDTGNGESSEDSGYSVEVSEIPVGGGTIFSDGLEGGQEIVVTQPEEGQFKAFSAICTHNKCVVTRVNRSSIICDCHQSHYDPATGEVQSGPAPDPLPEKKVQQRNGTLTIS